MTPETRMSKVRAVALAGTLLAMPQQLAPARPGGRHIETNPAAVSPEAKAVTIESAVSSLPDPVLSQQASQGIRLLPDPGDEVWFAPASARAPSYKGERFTITAYAVRQTGRVLAAARTKTGAVPQVGRTVAVDPRVIPLGTRLHIEGIGVRIAEDTGRAIKGRRIDLFVHSTAEGRRFGIRRGTQVRILAAEEPARLPGTARSNPGAPAS